MKCRIDFMEVGQFPAVLKCHRSEPGFVVRDEVVDGFSHGAIECFRLIYCVERSLASRCPKSISDHTDKILRHGYGC